MDYLTYRWTTQGITIYATHISVDLAHHEIFNAKVGKGGINILNACIYSIHVNIAC